MGRWIDYMELYGDIAITPKVRVRDIKNIKKPKANNNAPKSIKGDYELYIHGNKVKLFNQKDGMMVEARCHPDDNFDIGDGIKEAFKKMNEKREEVRKAKEEEEKKIRVGDWVEVVKPGEAYTTIVNLFEKYGICACAPYFRYGVVPAKGVSGKVLFVDEYNRVVFETVRDMAYGDDEYGKSSVDNGVYVVGIDGLRKVKKPL